MPRRPRSPTEVTFGMVAMTTDAVLVVEASCTLPVARSVMRTRPSGRNAKAVGCDAKGPSATLWIANPLGSTGCAAAVPKPAAAATQLRTARSVHVVMPDALIAISTPRASSLDPRGTVVSDDDDSTGIDRI